MDVEKQSLKSVHYDVKLKFAASIWSDVHFKNKKILL